MVVLFPTNRWRNFGMKIFDLNFKTGPRYIFREMIDTKPDTKYFNEVNIFKKLINTMEIIAMKGSATLYENGQIGQNLVKELPGILTAKDLVNYKVKEYKPNSTMIGMAIPVMEFQVQGYKGPPYKVRKIFA